MGYILYFAVRFMVSLQGVGVTTISLQEKSRRESPTSKEGDFPAGLG